MQKIRMFSMIAVVMALALVWALPVSAVETSGTCGENMTWAFDEATGTLTISGQGKMDAGEYPVWYDLHRNTTKIVIEEGVTSISRSAFSGFGGVVSVSLPSSLQTIEDNAFYGCGRMGNVSLTNVTSIGRYAFYGCASMTELTIPTGVKTVSYGAFSNCRALKKVDFHSDLTQIDGYAFSECVYLTSVAIPDSVKTIGKSAFNNCYNLASATLGSGLTELGDNAFSLCPSLKKIIIPDGVTKIETYTFSRCTSLQEVQIGSGVSNIDTTAFQGCSNLKAFTLSSANPNFSVDQGVLYNKSKTELFLMPEGFSGKYTVLSGTTKIGKFSCYGVTGMTSLTIPGSVTTIDEYAFAGCTGLKNIKLSNGLQAMGLYAFAQAGFSEITIPETVIKIGSLAFSRCPNLKKIVFTGNAPEIGAGAFTGLKVDVYYPDYKVGWRGATDLYGGVPNWIATSCKSHQPVTDPAKESTCAESGLTEGSHCSVCSAVIVEQRIIPAKGHTYDKWIKIDNNNHERTCTVCSQKEVKSHLWNDGIVTKQPNCKETGEERYTCIDCSATKTITVDKTNSHTYDNLCDEDCNLCDGIRTVTHSYSESYSNSKDGHWRQCKVCGLKKDFAEHIPGPASTGEMPQICTVCDYILQSSVNHTHHYAQSWTTDEQAHWHACDGCEEYGAYEAHSFNNNCDALCDTCGYTRETSHNYGGEWECDGVSHWHSCTVCGAQENAENHVPGVEATATTAQLCQVCGYELAHATGTQTDPTENTQPPEENRNAGGAVLLTVIVAGIAGAAVIVWKKGRKH